jgi:hypothetical protein
LILANTIPGRSFARCLGTCPEENSGIVEFSQVFANHALAVPPGRIAPPKPQNRPNSLILRAEPCCPRQWTASAPETVFVEAGGACKPSVKDPSRSLPRALRK